MNHWLHLNWMETISYVLCNYNLNKKNTNCLFYIKESDMTILVCVKYVKEINMIILICLATRN